MGTVPPLSTLWEFEGDQKFGGIFLLNNMESLQSLHMPSGLVVSFTPQIMQMTFSAMM